MITKVIKIAVVPSWDLAFYIPPLPNTFSNVVINKMIMIHCWYFELSPMFGSTIQKYRPDWLSWLVIFIFAIMLSSVLSDLWLWWRILLTIRFAYSPLIQVYLHLMTLNKNRTHKDKRLWLSESDLCQQNGTYKPFWLFCCCKDSWHQRDVHFL